MSLRYENIADAVNYTYALVLKVLSSLTPFERSSDNFHPQSDKQVSRESTKNASTTWLPYALIDQVLSAADGQMSTPPNLPELRTAINNRVKRMQKFSQNVS